MAMIFEILGAVLGLFVVERSSRQTVDLQKYFGSYFAVDSIAADVENGVLMIELELKLN